MSQRAAATLDTELCEVLDRVLHRGAVLRGEVVITVADIELLYLDLRLFLSSVDTAIRAGAWSPRASYIPPEEARGDDPTT